MKKIITGFLGLFFLFSSSYALENVSLFTPDLPTFSMEGGIEIPIDKDIKMNSIGGHQIFSTEMNELSSNMGVRFSKNKIDLTVTVNYDPVFFEKFTLGVDGIGHIYSYKNNFLELDGLLGLDFNWIGLENWIFNFNTGLLFKSAIIYSIAASIPYITNQTFTLGCSVKYIINQYVNTTVSFKSYNYFDYPLLGTPFLVVNVEGNPWKKLYVGTNLNFEFRDMFTISANMSHMDLQFYLKVCL